MHMSGVHHVFSLNTCFIHTCNRVLSSSRRRQEDPPPFRRILGGSDEHHKGVQRGVYDCLELEGCIAEHLLNHVVLHSGL